MPAPDQFEIVGEMPFSVLEERLHSITLLNQPDIHPYEDATISIERFTWEEVLPTSRYLRSANMTVQRAIRAAIAPHGYDQLELEGGLIITGGELGQQGLIPPIVERFEPEGVMPYVIDGSHRVNLGRLEGRDSFLGLFVRGIRSDCPPYAFPNSWDEIQEAAELPADKATWKNYRDFDNRYRLYRDYGPINGSAPRADSK